MLSVYKIYKPFPKNRIQDYLYQPNILSKNQYHLTQNKSSQGTIVHLRSPIRNYIDKGSPILAMVRDLA